MCPSDGLAWLCPCLRPCSLIVGRSGKITHPPLGVEGPAGLRVNKLLCSREVQVVWCVT
jgi:hypothetical protein